MRGRNAERKITHDRSYKSQNAFRNLRGENDLFLYIVSSTHPFSYHHGFADSQAFVNLNLEICPCPIRNTPRDFDSVDDAIDLICSTKLCLNTLYGQSPHLPCLVVIMCVMDHVRTEVSDMVRDGQDGGVVYPEMEEEFAAQE